jgi:predicted nuclease of predicted toxin-antitoxin system
MKLLLDENLPHQLRHELPGHDCYTVAFMGWGGVENGELLRRAASAGFDAVLTKDAGVQYEQNLTNLPLAVVILHAPSNDIDDIRPLLPALLQAPTSLRPNEITHVN